MAKKKAKNIKERSITTVSGIKDMWNGETWRFLVGLIFLLLSVFMILAFSSYFVNGAEDQSLIEDGRELNDIGNGIQNYAGSLGAQIAYYFINKCFGIPSFFICIFFIFASMKLMRAYKVRLWKWFINCSILMIWLSVSLQAFTPESVLDTLHFPPGGQHGVNIYNILKSQAGTLGVFILLFASAICYLVYISRETIEVVRKFFKPQDYIKLKRNKTLNEEVAEDADAKEEDEESKEYTDSQPQVIDLMGGETEDTTDEADEELIALENESEDENEEQDLVKAEDEEEPDFEIEEVLEEDKASTKEKKISKLEPFDPKKDLENYHYPTLDLLKKYDEGEPSVDMVEQNANKDRIITILRNFGVEIDKIKATVGPTITLYEITPAQGVRISKIRNLEDDIALSLSALGIRIIAPIPGKGTIGIEVPNAKPKIVSMESIINSKKFQESEFELPIALGKTITNEVFMVDLAKMPHLLVAGATGQGKSVGLNAVITSLLYKKHPAELKFVMVDPKKVEFSMYSPIVNHFLAKVPDENSDPIITDVTKVIQTLKSLCQEMDDRYDLLKRAHVRNVKEYNAKFKLRQLNPENGHRFMPYIVVIIDEFGDLIMTAGKEVELPIARIAQLARAVGIHMVIATQRPTTNIITGTIKANFPARMAFKVMSTIDSRTILDRTGANQLIGKGDLLFLVGSEPVRVQCAFVDTPEVERINEYIAKQQGYLSAMELPEVEMEGVDDSASSSSVDMNHLDPIFNDAARLIVIHQQGSTSLIQRKFAIGYNRAGRLMDQLERAGIVGPAQGSKPREVLCSSESDLELKISNLL
ncbi:MAG: DNA translocase FtsK 4TM domain-containing protein [Bacteroidaceae bacterium]